MVAAARAAAVALPLPLPGFKRAPGPVFRPRPRPVPEAPRERETQHGGLARRVGAFVVSLPDHPWLDRVVRGRGWIPLLGVLLAGIVAAQVEILKLGASMGRSLEQTSTLTNQNEQLQGSVAALSDDQRIQRLAGTMGLVLPPPGAVGYLVAKRDGNVTGALANIHTPDSASFVTMLAKNGAVVTGAGTSTLPPTAGAPTPQPPTTTATSSDPGTSATATTTTTTTTSTATATPATSPPDGTATSTTPAPATMSTPQPATTTPTTTPATAPATTEPSQTPATGAAAIQPSSTQPSAGG